MGCFFYTSCALGSHIPFIIKLIRGHGFNECTASKEIIGRGVNKSRRTTRKGALINWSEEM